MSGRDQRAERDEREILVDLGRVAYEGWRISVAPRELADWDDLKPATREHMRAAADAVRMWLDLHPRARDEASPS